MRTLVEGKANIMTEQCATSVSDIVEALIINASKLGYVADSVYERSQMLLEMRQKEAAQNTDESFAIENGIEHGIGGGKITDPANAKKRRSGSVKGICLLIIYLILLMYFYSIEFLVHMTNRLRRRSGSNNDSRDQTNVFLDQSGKLSSSSHTREHRYHYQQNSISGHCLSSSSSSTTTTKRKSSDDPNGGNSKRGYENSFSKMLTFRIFSDRKTKTTQEKSSLPDTNRFTSPITAFRRKKKTPGSSNDPGKSICYFYIIKPLSIHQVFLSKSNILIYHNYFILPMKFHYVLPTLLVIQHRLFHHHPHHHQQQHPVVP
jgi:hypothetical protein